MDYPVVRAKARPFTGKGYSRKVRVLGYLPAVLYGPGMPTKPIVVDPKTVVGILNSPRGMNTVVRLDIEGKEGLESCLALIKDYSIHPVKRVLEHCDFLKVDEAGELTVTVPIRTVGKSAGEKAGAKLNLALREVTIRCRPDCVPEAIEIDVTPLGVNESLLLSQLRYPEGTRPVITKDRTVVTVRMPKAEKGAEEAVEEGAATPEQTSAAQASEEGKK